MVWEKPECSAISWEDSRYQYRHRNTLRSTTLSCPKKRFTAPRVSRRIRSFSSVPAPETQSFSSSSASSICPPPRLKARVLRQRSMDKFRVIRPKNAEKGEGRLGGMEFQAENQVSLTHSSASSSFSNTCIAMEWQ